MKLFMEPAIEVAKFAVEDIITTSGAVEEEEEELTFSGTSCFGTGV